MAKAKKVAAKKAPAKAKGKPVKKTAAKKTTDNSGSEKVKSKHKESKVKMADASSISIRKAANGFVVDAENGKEHVTYVAPDAEKALSKVKALLGIKE